MKAYSYSGTTAICCWLLLSLPVVAAFVSLTKGSIPIAYQTYDSCNSASGVRPKQRAKYSTGSQLMSSAESSLRSAIDWVKKEPLESLLPKTDALAIISELLSDESLIDDAETLVATNWNSIERRIREEDRTVENLLGQELTGRLLDSIQSLGEEGGYDSEAVKAFLESPAINKLFAGMWMI